MVSESGRGAGSALVVTARSESFLDARPQFGPVVFGSEFGRIA